MNNQECKVKLEIVNVNSNEPVFCSFSIKTSKCNGSCNNINDPYAKLCVPNVVKNMNYKIFNLISRTNETKQIKWYETCKCKCRLDASVCNSKKCWNKDKCRCECKELIGKGICDKWFIWSTSNCKCEYDKSCDVGEYLDYVNCKCTKKLVDTLIQECTENVEVQLEGNSVEHKNKCKSSCTSYVVLIAIVFTIYIEIGNYFAYKYMNQ